MKAERIVLPRLSKHGRHIRFQTDPIGNASCPLYPDLENITQRWL